MNKKNPCLGGDFFLFPICCYLTKSFETVTLYRLCCIFTIRNDYPTKND